MRRLIGILLFAAFASGLACNTNKPAEEVNDAQDRVKDKIESAREEQKEAAEETGEN